MPTLRSRSAIIVTSPSFGAASVASGSLSNTVQCPAAAPLSTLITFAASIPISPAGDQEHSFPPLSPRLQRRRGAIRKRKGVEIKLQFAGQQHGVAVSVVRRSRRVSSADAEVVVAGAETVDDMTIVGNGKRKVVDFLSEEEENSKQIEADTSDAEEEIGTNSSLHDAGRGISHNHVRSGEGSGNGRRARRAKGSATASTLNVEAQISAAFAEIAELAPPSYADGPTVGASRSSRRGLPKAIVAEATKAKFREIARRRAAHFAHFPGEEDKPSVPTVNAAASGVSVDEQKSRASELVAGGAVGVRRPDDDGEQGDWPGPFIIARELVEGRAAAAVARQESTRVTGEKSKPLVEWSPSRQPYFREDRVATSLQDMCVEVLCANIEHVESLFGVPDSAKKRICARLCALRSMTPTAVRLYFESEPAEIVVPDCTFVTEENLKEAVTHCPTQQLEVLELGMCGRCLSDLLCTTSLAGLASSLPVLNTLTLKGAYRLTDNGLKALLCAAPKLISLNLNQCNMISATGLQAVADSVGPTLKALSLESCSQLEAVTLLPSLLKMSSIQNLSLSGISGMSDGIMSELAVMLGSNLQELSVADCRGLTDAAISALSLCCTHLRLLDLSHTPMLTDWAIGRLADGCRSLRTLRLNRGKFSDTALASLVTASGSCLCELSLNSVRQAGDYTLSALAKHSRSTLEQLDLSFCRAVSDQALGFLADSCSSLREIRLFGCTQVTKLFLEGHSNPVMNVIGLQNDSSSVPCLNQMPTGIILPQGGSLPCV